jgi:hypothetical protein
MSNVAANTETEEHVCANCGIAEVDDVKMEECDGCDLVKYCSDKCREEHRQQHDEECKKREAELHNIDLFSQPEGSYHGNCPICFLPLSLNIRKSMMKPCCSKLICEGCAYAHYKINGDHNCPFCREPTIDNLPNEDEIRRGMILKRIKAGDPVAMYQLGAMYRRDGEYDCAVEHLTKAAELGNAAAHYLLGFMYREGAGINRDAECENEAKKVENEYKKLLMDAVFSMYGYNPTGQFVEKDEEKAVYHLKKAAIGGHPEARLALARDDMENGSIDRSVRHLIIAANLGHEESMKMLWAQYSDGNITKEDLESTLRTHKAAIDATKSTQRDEAAAAKFFVSEELGKEFSGRL